MTLQKIFLPAFIGILTICFSASINAAVISSTGTDGDATLTLSIEDTLTLGVNQQWGEVRITVQDREVGFTAGDTIDISVFEDDLLGDELLWQTSFSVTSSEVASGLVDRFFAVIFTPTPDPGNFAEIYAEALVTKDACGFFCVNDRPTTNILPVTLVSPVPIPAAAWLFGSGLIGLIGVARRNKS